MLAGIALALAASLPPASAFAQTATWEGGDGPLWSSGDNWLGGDPPQADDTLLFTGSDDTTSENDLAAGLLVGGITIDRSDAASLFSLSGNLLVLGGDFVTSGLSGSAHLISLALRLNGNRTFEIGSGNDLVVSGPISEDAPGRGLAKTGLGTLVLGGNNSFSGDVSVQAGVLRLTHDSALGSSNWVEVANNARLEVAGGLTVSGRTVSITGGGGNNFGALQTTGSGAVVWDGDVFLAANAARVGAVSTSAPLTISGSVSDGGNNHSFAVRSSNGASTVTMSGVSTYGGQTQIIVGTLRLDGGHNRLPVGARLVLGNASNVDSATFDLNGFNQQVNGLDSLGTAMGWLVTNSSASLSTLTSHSSDNLTYLGALSGNLALVKSGGGTQTLAGASAHTGPVTVSGGILRIAHDGALGDVAGATTVLSGAQLSLADGVTVSGQTITLNGIGVTGSGGALQTDANATATWAGDIVLGTSARLGSGSNGTLIIDGVISGSGGVVVGRNTNSTTIFNAANTYSGATTLFASGGTGARLIVGIDDALPTTTVLNTLGAVATQAMILDLNGHRQTLQGLDSSASHSSGTFLQVRNDGATESILTLSSANSYNYSGTLADGISILHLVKEGSGTQRLFGNNTFTGTTTVRQGTLQVGFSTAGLGANGRLASAQIVLEGGTLDLNNTGSANQSNDRIYDGSEFRFRGGSLTYRGSDQASVDSHETLGAFHFDRGISRITNLYGAGNASTVTIAELVRAPGGGLGFFNGLDLGKDASSTANIARFLLASPPTLVGTTAALATGINAAAQDTEIVPYLLGHSSTASGGTGETATLPNTFVTYHSGTGLRPLNPTDEFTANAIVAGHNTRITAATTSSANAAINSLLIEGNSTSLTIASGTTLSVTSGAILFASGSSVTLGGTGTLDFGSREGLITINSTGNTFISPRITGSGGVTYHGSGILVANNGSSNYSGDTVLRVAQVVPTSSTSGPAGAPTSGPFGTGRLILDGSAMRSTTTADTTLGNELVIRADTAFIDAGATSKRLLFTGPATLEGGDRRLTQNSRADTVLSGALGDGGNGYGLVIDGTGFDGSGAVVLAGANTYGGGTRVEGATLIVDNASGSGTGSGAVTVLSGARLGGSGTIAGPTTIESGGTLMGGTAGGIGTLTLGGGLDSQAGSTWLIDLAQNIEGQSDRIAVAGFLSIDGATLTLNPSGAFVANTGFVYTIATYGSLNGTFSGLAEGAQVGNYLISYGNVTPGAITLTAVPEPGTLALLGAGLGGWLLRRRRARRCRKRQQ